MKFPLSTDKPIFRWGPLDGLLISIVATGEGIMYKMPQLYNFEWIDTTLLSKEDRWIWAHDNQDLIERSWQCYQQCIEPPKVYKKMRSNYVLHVKSIQEYIDSIRANKHVKLSNQDFLEFFLRWYNDYIVFWGHCAAPELATWGTVDSIQKDVEQLGVSTKEKSQLMEILTAPTEPSFFQLAEQELIKGWLNTQDDETARISMIEKYLDKYHWLNNSYGGATQFSRQDLLRQINSYEDLDQMKEEIEKIEQYAELMEKRRVKARQQFNLNDELMRKSRLLGQCVSWQDERKGVMFQHMYVMVECLKEFAKRYGLTYEQTTWLMPHELVELVDDIEQIKQIADERNKNCVVVMSCHEMTVIVNKEAGNLINIFWEDSTANQDGLQGVVACFGDGDSNIKGVAKIINTIKQASQFKAGEILVSPMTAPEFMPLIRQAKAIITDEGGLTCHAAVVSRELNIPCIVGAKKATKKIKNGDSVILHLDTGKITFD